jgi:hypothetical protein
MSRNINLVPFRHVVAAHAHRAARQRNVVQVETILAVGGVKFRIGLDLVRLRLLVDRVVDQPQRLRPGLVEVAGRAVSAQHIGEFEHRRPEPRSGRIPGGKPVRVERNDLERLGFNRLPRLEDPHLCLVDEV